MTSTRASETTWRRAGDAARVMALVSVPAGFVASGAEGGVRFAVVFAILLAPRLLGVPAPIDATFGVALLVAAWAGAVGWYQAASWVDVVVHFVTTGATAAAVYLMLVRLEVLPPAADADRWRSSLLLLVVAVGLAVGALWELYEWVGRNWLGNKSIHVGYDDTILDLTMDGLGSLVAGMLLLVTGLGRPARPAASTIPRT